jgi:hypothetical protein
MTRPAITEEQVTEASRKFKAAVQQLPPVVDAAQCTPCIALKTKACTVFYPNNGNGGWNPYGGKGVERCPAVLL